MKNIIKIIALAGILSGCAAVETGSSREAVSTPTSNAPVLTDAVTRGPVNEQRLPGSEPLIETVSSSGVKQGGEIDPTIDPSTARSYNASWEDGGFRHRSVMFPHIVDGCKVMVQSRRSLDYVGGTEGQFFEREGPDCNCDLVIDGFEGVFAQLADEYKTPRMLAVCEGPGVDGATRQLEIMRETLKEARNFDKMENVEGF